MTAYKARVGRASAKLSLNIGLINYGAKRLFLVDESTVLTPAVHKDVKTFLDSDFAIACAPEANWLEFDKSTGALSLKKEQDEEEETTEEEEDAEDKKKKKKKEKMKGNEEEDGTSGLTAETGRRLGRATACTIRKGHAHTEVMVWAPEFWKAFRWPWRVYEPGLACDWLPGCP